MATADELATFRRRIGDPAKADADVQTTNGSDKQFALRYNNVYEEVVQLDSVTQSSGYMLDGVTGIIEFDSPPPADMTLKVSYKYAAYTDAEAAALIDSYGLDKAVIEAIRELLADAARLYNYQQGSTRADKQQVFSNLKDLLKIYQADATNTANNGSGSLTLGRRTTEQYRQPRRIVEDFSRSDSWDG